MDVLLWILQVLLALAFGGAGFLKLSQPREKILENERMAWVNDFTQTQLRAIGLVEVLAAIGLILPKLTDILPWLTPLAAAGLVLTMIGAALTHIRRKEYPQIGINAVLGVLALVVVVGYWSEFGF